MSSRTHTYFFGRLNLLGSWKDKRQFIHEALTTEVFETRRGFKYGLFDIDELEINDELFVFGRLVKYKPLLEGEIVNEDSHELIEDGLIHGVVAKSEFYLHYRTGVIAYRPISNRISDNQFRVISATLIEAGHDHFFVNAEVQSVNEELAIEEAFSKFRHIERVSVDLHPTNPSNRDIYQRLDEKFKRLRASRFRQTIDATSEGLNQDALREDDAYSGLMMAVDGYGRGCIQGEIDDGRRVTIYTDDSPVTKEVVPSEENPRDVLYQLMPTFKRIWERMLR